MREPFRAFEAKAREALPGVLPAFGVGCGNDFAWECEFERLAPFASGGVWLASGDVPFTAGDASFCGCGFQKTIAHRRKALREKPQVARCSRRRPGIGMSARFDLRGVSWDFHADDRGRRSSSLGAIAARRSSGLGGSRTGR